jgi:undecaprenyl pyrophosphate synthase
MAATPTYSGMPAHIAIIMDGNGRWARARHRPRVFGHTQGVKTVRRVVEGASEIGVKCLTLYSFSTRCLISCANMLRAIWRPFIAAMCGFGYWGLAKD